MEEGGSSKAEKKGKSTGKGKGKGKHKGKNKRKSKEKEIKPCEIDFTWEENHAPYAKEQCNLKADIIHQFPEHHIPFDIFSVVTNFDGLVKLLVGESNLYAQQNGREFGTNKQEMRAFLGINYMIFINKLQTIKNYWEYGQFIGNKTIRNVMARSRFEDILRNFIYWTRQKVKNVKKVYEFRSLINHFNKVLVIMFEIMTLKEFTSIW